MSATLQDNSPLGAEDRAALDAILGRASPAQRVWLGGYVAGWQAAMAPVPPAPVLAAPALAAPILAAPVLPGATKAKLTVLFASESGNAESLAHAAGKAARKLGFAPRVLDMAETSPAELARTERLLVVASTWGEGDPPQRAEAFIAALEAEDAPSFAGTKFAVLALGDRAYARFCATGHALDARLAALGGERLAPVVECDVEFARPAGAWTERLLAVLGETVGSEAGANGAGASGVAGDAPRGDVIRVDFAKQFVEDEAPPAAPSPAQAVVTLHQELHSSRSGLSTTHLELSLEGTGITYQPGDALDVHVPNDPARVRQVLMAAGLADARSADAELERTLAGRDIATLTAGQVASYAQATQDSGLAALAADSVRLPAWLEGRQLIDLLAEGGHGLAPETLLGLTRKLAPRAYSIASSKALVGEEAHLLVGLVRWEGHRLHELGCEREGVASGHLARRVGVGGTVAVSLRRNRHFRLPGDARPVVMIGPGTGVAPFRGFLQEREASGRGGPAWLFFGHRRYTHDFLYQLEIQEWLKAGVLSRLDVAFSRDQPEKIYVQHRLWQRREELRRWISDGAAIYVCGDAKAMARDVHATLRRILAEEGGAEDAAGRLQAMQRDGRYLRDVY